MAGHGMGDSGLVGVRQGMGEAGHGRDALLVEVVAEHRGEAGWKQETHLLVRVGRVSKTTVIHSFLFTLLRKQIIGGGGGGWNDFHSKQTSQLLQLNKYECLPATFSDMALVGCV